MPYLDKQPVKVSNLWWGVDVAGSVRGTLGLPFQLTSFGMIIEGSRYMIS